VNTCLVLSRPAIDRKVKALKYKADPLQSKPLGTTHASFIIATLALLSSSKKRMSFQYTTDKIGRND
jgi:hypothetical protein